MLRILKNITQEDLCGLAEDIDENEIVQNIISNNELSRSKKTPINLEFFNCFSFQVRYHEVP